MDNIDAPTSAEIVMLIFETTANNMVYMLPVIAAFAAVKIVIDLLFDSAFSITGRNKNG